MTMLHNLNQESLVSVIVLTYNQADTVGRALDSILMQHVDFNYEIVVSDDCSTDATREILDGYAQKHKDRIRLMPRSVRRGVVDNYFYALSQCRGEFIADCAGDDRWLDSDGLQRRVDRLLEDTSMTFVCADWQTDDGNTTKIHNGLVPKNRKLKGADYIEAMLASKGAPLIHLSTVVYRRNVLEAALTECKGIVWNSGYGSEDLPVVLALLNRGNFMWIDRLVLSYTVGEDTVSSPKDYVAASDYYCRTARMIYDLANHYGIAWNRIKPVVNDKINYAMACALNSKNKKLQQQVIDCAGHLGASITLKNRLRIFFGI